MRIVVALFPPPARTAGNRVTAARWTRIFRELGHRVRARIDPRRPERCDVLVALHAARSARFVRTFRARHPGTPVIVALTGTDHRDIHRNARARRNLLDAERVIAIQPLMLGRLPADVRRKTVVIHQSVVRSAGGAPRRTGVFEVAVVGHLRAVKDPFRTALASRLLPAASTIRVVHAGKALDVREARRARDEMRANPRYRWLGELTAAKARALLQRVRVLCHTSLSEGGAHVVGEACVEGTAVLASRIDGNVGLLGARYPGYFEPRDTAALGALLWRVEREPAFLRRLERGVRGRAPLFDREREVLAWRRILDGLGKEFGLHE